jgi:hypothetical protein
MSYIPTHRNHYNPCFWTALWNEGYFESWASGVKSKEKPRKQVVYALNLRADRIFPTSVERVHFDKQLGIAEITAESMRDFTRRRHPEQYAELDDYLKSNPESLFIDFEQVLEGMERTQAYDALMNAAKQSNFDSVEHKSFLTVMLVLHAMRSHEFMSAMIDTPDDIPNVDKWEYFWMLRNDWSDPLALSRATLPLSMGQWILYRTKKHHFPLCDSPVMVNRTSVMAILSPRLLLEISLDNTRPEGHWLVRDGISSSKYREFRRRAIANTFNAIIFHDSKVLENWRSLPEYTRRTKELAAPETQRSLILEAANRVLWMISGMGRVPDDFEKIIRPYLEDTATED